MARRKGEGEYVGDKVLSKKNRKKSRPEQLSEDLVLVERRQREILSPTTTHLRGRESALDLEGISKDKLMFN